MVGREVEQHRAPPGANAAVSSSWKEDASQTTVAPGSSSPTSERQRACRRCPPRPPAAPPRGGCGRAARPSSSCRWCPVTAMNSLGSRRQASSSSPSTGSPRSRAAAITGASAARPGSCPRRARPRAGRGRRPARGAPEGPDVGRDRVADGPGVDGDDLLPAGAQRAGRGHAGAREADDQKRAGRQRPPVSAAWLARHARASATSLVPREAAARGCRRDDPSAADPRLATCSRIVAAVCAAIGSRVPAVRHVSAARPAGVRGRPPLPPGPYLVVGLARSGVAAARRCARAARRSSRVDAGAVGDAVAADLAAAGVAVHAPADGLGHLRARARRGQEPGRAAEAPVIAARARRAGCPCSASSSSAGGCCANESSR